mmetsp:Transcript_3931/g.9122  ORF Transcript_3931/g.9122 Transcript_3931/m.9122 type:complete len:293 (-) Transcript_3931:291-1169(-)
MSLVFATTRSSSDDMSDRSRASSSSTRRRRLSTSKRNEEAMSRTVLMEESMSSFMSFQLTMSVFASSLTCICWFTSPTSKPIWWQRSCASCKLWETSSIQASCALRASCMSPISKRMVEISAVTVASTRWRDVMMECVESTRARISSKSTFTASMAAVKSSMSRSHASTMRFTWSVSCFAPFSKSFSSPTSYFTASMSRERLSAPGTSSAPVLWERKKETFLSTSWVSVWICDATWASKSDILLVSLLTSWPSDAFEESRPPGVSAPALSARSARTRDSSFLNCSLKPTSAF